MGMMTIIYACHYLRIFNTGLVTCYAAYHNMRIFFS